MGIKTGRNTQEDSVAAVSVCPRATLFVFPGEWGQSATRLPTKPGFSLPKVILLRHNTDLSCKRLLCKDEDRKREPGDKKNNEHCT